MDVSSFDISSAPEKPTNACYFGHILGQYLDFNYIFGTLDRKGSTIGHFAAGGLRIKDEPAICRSSLLKGGALLLALKIQKA